MWYPDLTEENALRPHDLKRVAVDEVNERLIRDKNVPLIDVSDHNPPLMQTVKGHRHVAGTAHEKVPVCSREDRGSFRRAIELVDFFRD